MSYSWAALLPGKPQGVAAHPLPPHYLFTCLPPAASAQRHTWEPSSRRVGFDNELAPGPGWSNSPGDLESSSSSTSFSSPKDKQGPFPCSLK